MHVWISRLCYHKRMYACVALKGLTIIMLLVANLANAKLCKKPEKWVKLLQMGTHMKVLSESFPMNTNMTGFRCFSKIFASLCFGQKKPQHWKG